MSTGNGTGTEAGAAGRGRAALFGPPPLTAAAARRAAGHDTGRQALFSAPPRRRGSVVVECSRCQARTPVPLVDLGLRLVPSLWVPGRPFSRWMRCPACSAFTWCRVQWHTLWS